MKHKIIKIDTAFSQSYDNDLVRLLDEGWIILSKTVSNNRYIYFILRSLIISYQAKDVGKCSYGNDAQPIK